MYKRWVINLKKISRKFLIDYFVGVYVVAMSVFISLYVLRINDDIVLLFFNAFITANLKEFIFDPLVRYFNNQEGKEIFEEKIFRKTILQFLYCLLIYTLILLISVFLFKIYYDPILIGLIFQVIYMASKYSFTYILNKR